MTKAEAEPDAIAVVVGATGGIGRALVARLGYDRGHARIVGLARTATPRLDLLDEETIAAAAAELAEAGAAVRLIMDATGVLGGDGLEPEKSLKQLDPAAMAQAFAVNAIGPALLMKHFLPLLPRQGRSVFATLSAKVGSIGDNRLGGWYSYRASKAALNQLVRTAAIELRRRAPEAICVALHPGTVVTPLSQRFVASGPGVHSPDEAADHLLRVIAGLVPEQSGGFFDWRGDALPW